MNLTQLVNRTRLTFNWYDNLLEGLDLYNISISEFPIITEDILEERYFHHPHQNLDHFYEYYTSGTSSKKRKRVLYSENDQAIYLQQRQSIIKDFCGSRYSRSCADLGTGHAAATATTIFKSMGFEVVSIDFTRPIAEHLEILNKFQPEIFFTMPVILDNLINTQRLNINPKKIILLGDIATQAWQRNIANYFDIHTHDILDLFGSIEIGSIAFYNHELGCYQFDSYIFPECIHPSKLYPDINYEGHGDILLLTSYAREYFPAIRFVTNDLIVGFEIKEHKGKEIYTFQHSLGRFSTEYKHGEKVNLYDINEAIVNQVSNILYDVNDSNGVLTIRLGSTYIAPHVIQKIKDDIRKRNPVVDQMISSGLVPDIEIHNVNPEKINSNTYKRSY